MSLRFHIFVSDVDPENEDFMCKRVGSRFSCLAPPRDGKILLRSSVSCKKGICLGSEVWGCVKFENTGNHFFFFFDFVILSSGKQ